MNLQRVVRGVVALGASSLMYAATSASAEQGALRPAKIKADGTEFCTAYALPGTKQCAAHCELGQKAICHDAASPKGEPSCDCQGESKGGAQAADKTPPEPPVTKSIGAEGGEVSSSDGLFTVTIPPGALDKATPISVTRIKHGWMPPTYRLEPDGLPLKKKGKVTMRAPKGSTEQDLQEPSLRKDGEGAYAPQEAVVDAQAQTKVVEIDHL